MNDPLPTPLRRSLDRAAYHAQQWSIRFPIATARRALGRLVPPSAERPSPGAIATIEQRYQDLLETDLANVEAGAYPRELLFQMPFGRYARALPRLLADLPAVVWRSWTGNHGDLPATEPLERYPDYYRRTFHWQTDGYLSRRSAALYDVEVELLFAGTADVMRRQVIPPIARHLEAHPAPGAATRLLDVGCGTGRTLAQIAIAQPGLRLFGLDLSPHYIATARTVLDAVPDVSLVAENAEHMPFRDEYFDVVVSVYLFHELPPPARQRVLAEMHRVLRPGGLVVIEDSAQLAESGELAFFLSRFAAGFHEPYYRGYVRDDLAARLEEAGFTLEDVQPHFVSKVLVARKP